MQVGPWKEGSRLYSTLEKTEEMSKAKEKTDLRQTNIEKRIPDIQSGLCHVITRTSKSFWDQD